MEVLQPLSHDLLPPPSLGLLGRSYILGDSGQEDGDSDFSPIRQEMWTRSVIQTVVYLTTPMRSTTMHTLLSSKSMYTALVK